MHVAICGCKAVCRRADTAEVVEVDVADSCQVTNVHYADEDWVIPDDSTRTCRSRCRPRIIRSLWPTSAAASRSRRSPGRRGRPWPRRPSRGGPLRFDIARGKL
jgi:hypothetical protein